MRCARTVLIIIAGAFLLDGVSAWAQSLGPAVPSAMRPHNLQPGDAFGEEVAMTARPIVYFSGSATWDGAFETIVDGFKTVTAYLQKQGIQPDGRLMTIYTSSNDAGFQFQDAVPVAEPPQAQHQGDIAVGQSPGGQAYKFIHRGSYDVMGTTYDAITKFLDEKGIAAANVYIEQYLTNPLTTPKDKLVIEVYVPVK